MWPKSAQTHLPHAILKYTRLTLQKKRLGVKRKSTAYEEVTKGYLLVFDKQHPSRVVGMKCQSSRQCHDCAVSPCCNRLEDLQEVFVFCEGTLEA